MTGGMKSMTERARELLETLYKELDLGEVPFWATTLVAGALLSEVMSERQRVLNHITHELEMYDNHYEGSPEEYRAVTHALHQVEKRVRSGSSVLDYGPHTPAG